MMQHLIFFFSTDGSCKQMSHFQIAFWIPLISIGLLLIRITANPLAISEALSTQCAIGCGVVADNCEKESVRSQLNLEYCMNKMLECVRHCTGPSPVENYYY
ncbi:unnamed protein product [Heterobilharzia americana]|nr:unnamed protein product [Heterobilharzia americana]